MAATSPRPPREKTTDSPSAPGLRSDGHAGAEEESWSLMNRRRAELIFENNRGPLSDDERSELEHLQTLSIARMQRDFPGPSLIDEQLQKIEEQLGVDEAEKA